MINVLCFVDIVLLKRELQFPVQASFSRLKVVDLTRLSSSNFSIYHRDNYLSQLELLGFEFDPIKRDITSGITSMIYDQVIFPDFTNCKKSKSSFPQCQFTNFRSIILDAGVSANLRIGFSALQSSFLLPLVVDICCLLPCFIDLLIIFINPSENLELIELIVILVKLGQKGLILLGSFRIGHGSFFLILVGNDLGSGFTVCLVLVQRSFVEDQSLRFGFRKEFLSTLTLGFRCAWLLV